MSDIFVMIRNQDNIVLTSIDGIAFSTLLWRDNRLLAEEKVELIYADAGFDDLPVGEYIVAVIHEGVEPQEVTYDVEIASEDDVIMLTFFYLEPERVLMGVRSSIEKRL